MGRQAGRGNRRGSRRLSRAGSLCSSPKSGEGSEALENVTMNGHKGVRIIEQISMGEDSRGVSSFVME